MGDIDTSWMEKGAKCFFEFFNSSPDLKEGAELEYLTGDYISHDLKKKKCTVSYEGKNMDLDIDKVF